MKGRPVGTHRSGMVFARGQTILHLKWDETQQSINLKAAKPAFNISYAWPKFVLMQTSKMIPTIFHLQACRLCLLFLKLGKHPLTRAAPDLWIALQIMRSGKHFRDFKGLYLWCGNIAIFFSPSSLAFHRYSSLTARSILTSLSLSLSAILHLSHSP